MCLFTVVLVKQFIYNIITVESFSRCVRKMARVNGSKDGMGESIVSPAEVGEWTGEEVSRISVLPISIGCD